MLRARDSGFWSAGDSWLSLWEESFFTEGVSAWAPPPPLAFPVLGIHLVVLDSIDNRVGRGRANISCPS